MRGLWAVLISAAALAACATAEQKIAETAAVKSKSDPFLPYREYATGEMQGGDSLTLFQGSSQKRLAARIDKKTGATVAFLEYEIVYTDEAKRGYQSARNTNADLLKIAVVKSRKFDCSKKTDSCLVDEILQIDLPVQGLKQAGPQGYPIKLFARSGPHVQIDIPAVWIANLFAKVDADNAIAAAPQPQSAAGQQAATH